MLQCITRLTCLLNKTKIYQWTQKIGEWGGCLKGERADSIGSWKESPEQERVYKFSQKSVVNCWDEFKPITISNRNFGEKDGVHWK